MIMIQFSIQIEFYFHMIVDFYEVYSSHLTHTVYGLYTDPLEKNGKVIN